LFFVFCVGVGFCECGGKGGVLGGGVGWGWWGGGGCFFWGGGVEHFCLMNETCTFYSHANLRVFHDT